MSKDYVPYLEIKMSLDELRAVIKSLGIGLDQLAKKIQRMGDDPRANDIVDEFVLLSSAKSEMEETMVEAMRN